MSAWGPILLQKSPRRSCRIKIRNNRIGANGFLNQRCALTPDLESILRTQTDKIVLQQNLPLPDSCTTANDVKKLQYLLRSSTAVFNVVQSRRRAVELTFSPRRRCGIQRITGSPFGLPI